jgi:hypothetical protein
MTDAAGDALDARFRAAISAESGTLVARKTTPPASRDA